MAIVFSDNLILSMQVQPDLSPKYARICYDKLVATNIAASTESAGYPASAADNEMTYSYWKPSTGINEYWQIDGAPKEVNYCGIAAHTLSDVGCDVTIQYFDGSAWVEIADKLPINNAPVLFLFENITASQFRVVINGGSGAPRIGVIQFGKSLVMPHSIYGGHSPITLSRQTIIRPNKSEGGQMLGRRIVRGGSASSYAWQHLDATWYRAYFDPFVQHARAKPFFIAWRPDKFPDEVGYVESNQDIQPQNMGIRNLMSVTLNVEGLAID